MDHPRQDGCVLRFLGVLLLLGCSGCAAFLGGELARLDPAELRTQPRLPPISYQIRQGANPNSAEMGQGWPSAPAEALFCSAFTGARHGPAEGDLHSDLAHFNVVRQPVFSLTLGLFTLASLGIIPTYIEEDFTLTVRVEYKGQLAQEYLYKDHVSIWIEVFMIFWSFSNDPVETERANFENMLLHLIRDLRRDIPRIVAGS